MSIKKRIFAFTACLIFVLSTVIVPVAASLSLDSPFCPSCEMGTFQLADYTELEFSCIDDQFHSYDEYEVYECNCGATFRGDMIGTTIENHSYEEWHPDVWVCTWCGHVAEVYK